MKILKVLLSTLAIGIIGAIILIARMGKEKEKEKTQKSGKKTNPTLPAQPLPPTPEPKINKNQAKMVFLLNINKFAPILPSLNNETFDCRLWTEIIVTINDYHLTKLWEKYVSAGETQERWKRLLASWQVKSDDCKSFTCTRKDNMLSYTLPNGDSITMGEKYKVENACWVYTCEEQGGNVIKRIISKGIVIPFKE